MLVYNNKTVDADLIKSIITSEDIWSSVSESNQLKEEYEPPITDGIDWVQLTNENSDTIGLLLIHPTSSIACVAHINILKKYRVNNSIDAGLACADYMINKTHYHKFNTEVPVMYKNVMSFLEYFGFEQQGTNKESILKDDKPTDQVMYGVTRPQLVQRITNIIKEQT